MRVEPDFDKWKKNRKKTLYLSPEFDMIWRRIHAMSVKQNWPFAACMGIALKEAAEKKGR